MIYETIVMFYPLFFGIIIYSLYKNPKNEEKGIVYSLRKN